MFNFFTVLIIGLMFSPSFNTLAQQKAGTTTGPDADTVSLNAKTAAKQDASNNFKRLLWVGVGAVVGIVGCAVGIIAGIRVGSMLDPVDTPGTLFFETSTGEEIGCLTGGAVGILAPLIGIYRYPVHLPSERLIGKSPEYVAAYTDAYQETTRSQRTKSAAAGACLGIVGIIGLLFLAAVL